VDKDVILESTGLYSKSLLMYIDINTQKIINETQISSNYFGEGNDLI
jgi:glutamine cyclotransferase